MTKDCLTSITVESTLSMNLGRKRGTNEGQAWHSIRLLPPQRMNYISLRFGQDKTLMMHTMSR